MTRLPPETLAVLRWALAAARRTLADMEDDEIPAPLRKVAQSSARTLPPPLSKSLIDHLDTDDGFRHRVSEEAPEDLDETARMFLDRGPGWWSHLAAVVAADGLEASAQQVAKVEREIARLERFVSEAKVRAEEARTEADYARAESKKKVGEARARVRQLAAADQVSATTETLRVVELEERIEQISGDAAELRGVVDSLRERLRKMRKGRGLEARAATASFPADPIAMARALDHQLDMVTRPGPGAHSDATPATITRFGLPAGVSPDSPDALTWLQTAPAATVIVDGYNVLYRAVGERSAMGAARSRLEAALQRLHLQSANRHSVIVVYDSVLSGDRPPAVRSKGLEIRFAPADRVADEEIADLTLELTGRLVVVSNDREVRESAQDAGAVALWSDVLLPML